MYKDKIFSIYLGLINLIEMRSIVIVLIFLKLSLNLKFKRELK